MFGFIIHVNVSGANQIPSMSMALHFRFLPNIVWWNITNYPIAQIVQPPITKLSSPFILFCGLVKIF
jgi:hypothetical protein